MFYVWMKYGWRLIFPHVVNSIPNYSCKRVPRQIFQWMLSQCPLTIKDKTQPLSNRRNVRCYGYSVQRLYFLFTKNRLETIYSGDQVIYVLVTFIDIFTSTCSSLWNGFFGYNMSSYTTNISASPVNGLKQRHTLFPGKNLHTAKISKLLKQVIFKYKVFSIHILLL